MSEAPHFTVFAGNRRLMTGPLVEVALAVRKTTKTGGSEPIVVFDDTTGRPIDLDLRGSHQEIMARLAAPISRQEVASEEPPAESRGRGRPKLGVVAREVTLLPRHWDWLATQPGGASVALRKLVEEARRTSGDRDRQRAARDAAYHFMSTMAGNWQGFEDASRALFADDRRHFGELIARWPADIRDHTVRLAFGDVFPAVT